MKRKHFNPLLPVIMVCCACFFPGCTPTQNCGTWAFNGNTQTIDGRSSLPLSSAFTFVPSDCGKDCTISTDCQIQAVWVYDSVDRTYEYATSSYAARTTTNGWTIDRVDGSANGYYGLLNDGVTFYSGWNTTGSNNNATTLYDEPGGWPPNTWFYAIDVPVSFNTPTYNNKILGYYFWSWTIDNNGIPSKFITAPAWKSLDTEFQDALAAWNAWAPGSGTEDSHTSGQPVKPHANPFPALTDL